jgi:arsenite-transporting ATPase
MRIIVYTGKGGVGKTSMAAATAVRLASQGLRTLVMSTDAAHNLKDSFQMELGADPVQVTDHLWAQEVDNLTETERNWGRIQNWFSGVLAWSQLEDVSAEEMMAFPGLEELFSLLKIIDHAKSGQFDVLIVDCAPTGETLRLLSYPNVFIWWLDKIFPHQRRLLKLARPVAKVVAGGLELPNDQVLNDIEKLVRKVIEVQSLLLDPSITSVRIVLNPEKMVIAEARRSFTYLNLYGFNTDAIIVNRVLPEEVGSGYWEEWRKIQQQYEAEIRNSFHPLPILRVPLMRSEITGLSSLKELADVMFKDLDPGQVLHQGKIEEMKKEADGYVLYLTLPFVDRTDLNLTQRGDELTLQAGAYRRKVYLPRVLAGRPILGARFKEHRLRILFGERSSISEEQEE